MARFAGLCLFALAAVAQASDALRGADKKPHVDTWAASDKSWSEAMWEKKMDGFHAHMDDGGPVLPGWPREMPKKQASFKLPPSSGAGWEGPTGSAAANAAGSNYEL